MTTKRPMLTVASAGLLVTRLLPSMGPVDLGDAFSAFQGQVITCNSMANNLVGTPFNDITYGHGTGHDDCVDALPVVRC